MKIMFFNLFPFLLFFIIGVSGTHAQNPNNAQRVSDENLELSFCDEDGFMTFNIEEIEDLVFENLGFENENYLEQVLISTANGNVLSVNLPSNNPYITYECELFGNLTDIAVNSNQEIFICSGNPLRRIDENCNVYSYNYSFFQNNALSFDDQDNLYLGLGTESYIMQINIDGTTLTSSIWHDFQTGASGGDFVMLNDKMYISWRLGSDNYRLYEVTLDENRNYVSYIDLGQLPNETYGLASELGKLYGVTPHRLFEINLSNLEFATIIFNPDSDDAWNGAAGLHEAIVYETSTHLTLDEAQNGTNPLSENWTNTVQGGQLFYIRIENLSTGEYQIVLLNISLYYPIVDEPLDLVMCYNNTFNVFNLDQISSQMLIDPSQNYSFTFYNTDPEANPNSIPISTEYQSLEEEETLFVKVEDNNCYLVYSFEIKNKNIVYLPPTSTLQSPRLLNSCYFDNNGDGYFYLSNIEGEMVIGDGNVESTYYLNYLDAENNVGEIPLIFYPESPIQEIFIKATDEQGCYTISNFFVSTECFTNKALSSIVFPKFFTPNNDGINDYWQIRGDRVDKFPNSEIFIYDRYGKMIAQISPEDVGWDGYYNGKRMFSNDYWFVFRIESGVEIKGHFTLKR